MIYEEQVLLFCILVFAVFAFFGGWFAKIAVDQYKADKRREKEAERRRIEYELREELHRRFDESIRQGEDAGL